MSLLSQFSAKFRERNLRVAFEGWMKAKTTEDQGKYRQKIFEALEHVDPHLFVVFPETPEREAFGNWPLNLAIEFADVLLAQGLIDRGGAPTGGEFLSWIHVFGEADASKTQQMLKMGRLLGRYPQSAQDPQGMLSAQGTHESWRKAVMKLELAKQEQVLQIMVDLDLRAYLLGDWHRAPLLALVLPSGQTEEGQRQLAGLIATCWSNKGVWDAQTERDVIVSHLPEGEDKSQVSARKIM